MYNLYYSPFMRCVCVRRAYVAHVCRTHLSLRRPMRMRRALASAKRHAHASPIPAVAPVMRTV